MARRPLLSGATGRKCPSSASDAAPGRVPGMMAVIHGTRLGSYPPPAPHDAEENHTGDGLVASRAGDDVPATTSLRGVVRSGIAWDEERGQVVAERADVVQRRDQSDVPVRPDEHEVLDAGQVACGGPVH
ncbi:hypothetical protein JJ691_65010 [Kutzneria sp. CA-103260]|nr:hypothetical protein JJ691_65010 [Kutzneria sp. CA-103260]